MGGGTVSKVEVRSEPKGYPPVRTGPITTYREGLAAQNPLQSHEGVCIMVFCPIFLAETVKKNDLFLAEFFSGLWISSPPGLWHSAPVSESEVSRASFGVGRDFSQIFSLQEAYGAITCLYGGIKSLIFFSVRADYCLPEVCKIWDNLKKEWPQNWAKGQGSKAQDYMYSM